MGYPIYRDDNPLLITSFFMSKKTDLLIMILLNRIIINKIKRTANLLDKKP